MKILASLIFSALLVVGLSGILVDAGWRAECSFGGSAQFHVFNGKPYLSTMCPDNQNNQICSMLDLNYCLMNSAGHVKWTIKYVLSACVVLCLSSCQPFKLEPTGSESG